jgi:hypothetical protein
MASAAAQLAEMSAVRELLPDPVLEVRGILGARSLAAKTPQL